MTKAEETRACGWDPTLYGHKDPSDRFEGSEQEVKILIKELGATVTTEQLALILNNIKKTKGNKNHIDKEKAKSIVKDVVKDIPSAIYVRSSTITGGSMVRPSAYVELVSQGGDSIREVTANCPFTALFVAVLTATIELCSELEDRRVNWEDFSSSSIFLEGKFLRNMSVVISVGGAGGNNDSSYNGQASNVDITQALAQAFANALSLAVADLRK